MTPQRIKEAAEAYSGLMVWTNSSPNPGETHEFHDYISTTSYIAGATAENDRAKQRVKKLIDVFDKIAHAPVPANEREYISWFVTAKNIARGVISEWEAENELAKWKGEGEQTDEEKYQQWIKESVTVLGEFDFIVGYKRITGKKELRRVYEYLTNKK